MTAYLSYQISKSALDYQISKDSFEKTPVLRETVDSTFIEFGLSNDSELQLLSINFPSKIHSPIKLLTKPIKLNKSIIEDIAKDYINTQLSNSDSIMRFGTFSLPVMIDYSAITHGDSHELRENRFLLFNFFQTPGKITVLYSNSFLNNRYGFPLKSHYFFTIPFTGKLNEKINRQDSVDVQELLHNQLEFLNREFN